MAFKIYRFVLRMGAILMGLASYKFVEAIIMGSLNFFVAAVLAATCGYCAYKMFCTAGQKPHKRAPRSRRPNSGAPFDYDADMLAPRVAPARMGHPGRAA